MIGSQCEMLLHSPMSMVLSQDTWEQCQNTLLGKSPLMWQLGGESEQKRKKKSESEGKSFELTPKRKRDGDKDLAACCLLA